MRKNPTQIFILFFITIITSPAATFSAAAPLFPSANITIMGDVTVSDDSITLTPHRNCTADAPPDSLSGFGRAFYFNPVGFIDPTTNSTVSFFCSFSFTITLSAPSCSFGDGLALLITSDVSSFSASDGFMGLPEEPPTNQDSFLAVEFDTSFDPFLEDLNDNHIGIDLNSVKSVASVDVVPRGVDLKSGREMTAWVQYIDQERVMRIWVGHNSQVRPPDPILESPIDLSNQFKEFMHVGFAAANGQGSAVYSINRWMFKTSAFLASTESIDAIEETDCLMCIHVDNELERNGKSGSGSGNVHRKRSKSPLIGGLLSAAVVLVFAIVASAWVWVSRNRNKGEQNNALMSRVQRNRVPQRLTLNELRSATEGFSQERIVGEGSSAVVYQGSIPSRGAVAVKRFVNESGPSHIPFNTEFASMVGCLRHKNLIQLQGWCCERNELILVYEFMPNGTLDKLLRSPSRSLNWEKRLNIIKGVASALVYLHEECQNQIIHRDVKSCNVMLDSEFNPKLGDFGVAQVFDSSKARDSTVPAGTMGYLAPEYAFSGIPSVKTDVYSFGVVALEVASGRRPVDEEGVVIGAWVWDLWEKGRITEAADPRLSNNFNRLQMDRVLMVGLCCLIPDHEKRPTMRDVSRMLNDDSPLPILPPRKPAIRIQSVRPEALSDDEFRRSSAVRLDDDTPWATPRTHF